MAKSASDVLFIGGAEKARRNARKQKNRPPPRSNKSNKRYRHNELPPYPKSMRQYDRFFGSLLSSTLESFQQSQMDEEVHDNLMTRCCSLLNVPSLPPAPIRSSFHRSMEQHCDARSHHLLQRTSSFLSDASFASTKFDNARSYYMSKAPLILEESRCIIADALSKLSHQKSGGVVLSLQLLSVDEKYPQIIQQQHAPLLLNFRIDKVRDKEKGISWSRPGNIFILSRCSKGNGDANLQSSVLACIAPMIQKRDSDEDNGSLKSTYISLMIFQRTDLSDIDCSRDSNNKHFFHAVALTTLISQVRQMEACLRMTKVSFMSKLLGCKKSTHIRFNDSDEEEVVEDVISLEEEVLVDDIEKTNNLEHRDGARRKSFLAKLPQLNLTQEKAASSFLNSLSSSLILVQGPPGTGKSTFVVNVICRRLFSDPNARILVTAPTNKAVTVLAQKFLDAINNDTTMDNINPVLIGVEDKLVNDDRLLSPDVMTTSLRSIFAYTWMETVKDEWMVLLDTLGNLTKEDSLEALVERAKNMKCKLSNGIPRSSSTCDYDGNELVRKLKVAAAAKMWEASREGFSDDLELNTSSHLIDDAMRHGRNLLEMLKDIDSSDVVSELLSTARLIFCTLSTAGSSILKHTHQVDDLIVDEAAAATEAEICIPFHLRPKRMLAVGDPMQLPPTIISRRAANLGLSKSMHDRLMNDCQEDYFMLDKQYRMVPSIAYFPCKQFYDGNITDGENVTCPKYSSNKLPYAFIHVVGEEYRARCGSYANQEECDKIIQIIQAMRLRAKDTDWDSVDKIRVITFYQAQTTLLKSLLAKRKLNVLVATVDSSQGCEADTVIVSFTRSNNNKGVLQAAGFLADDRRINVAITRGRHQLICVGNTDTLGFEGSDALKQLVLDARQRRCITHVNDYLSL